MPILTAQEGHKYLIGADVTTAFAFRRRLFVKSQRQTSESVQLSRVVTILAMLRSQIKPAIA
jgi:hypothetical protein